MTARTFFAECLTLLAGVAVVAPSGGSLPAQAAAATPAMRLALTPPMGWNSWNKFACNVSEQLIRETADAMVRTGMRDAGYQYVNIDDCWHGQRDSLGFIHPDSARFPSGLRALADYVHARGLKLGIYSDAGSKTCGGRPGSRGYERQDALMYAKWGVDYLKYDWCNTEELNAHGAYLTMHDALAATGRPIVFSICEWGTNKPWEWGATVGQLWRTTGDITPCFDCIDTHGGQWNAYGVLQILDMQQGLRRFAGPGHWNDPDMLEVGNGLSASENRAHFTMWSMLAAPLIAGNDLRSMPPDVASVLMNRDVVAVDQDSLGVEGFRYSAGDSLEIWFKPLVRGDWAMAVLNRAKSPRHVAFDWARQAVADSLSGRSASFGTTRYTIRDLWSGREMGTTQRALGADVAPHDILLMRLRPKNAASLGSTERTNIGYGTQLRSESNVAVGSIDADELGSETVTTWEQLIVGRVAGLEVTHDASGMTLRIRGTSTLHADSEPLIVLDGVQLSGGGNLLLSVNPRDVQRIEVLKDAGATAIYGSRGANGVVLVTLRKHVR